MDNQPYRAERGLLGLYEGICLRPDDVLLGGGRGFGLIFGPGNCSPQGHNGSRASRLAPMKATGQELLGVEKRLLIIADGLIGSEPPGDIVSFSSGKKNVTLVHAKELLGDPTFAKPPAAKMIQRKLPRLGFEACFSAHMQSSKTMASPQFSRTPAKRSRPIRSFALPVCRHNIGLFLLTMPDGSWLPRHG